MSYQQTVAGAGPIDVVVVRVTGTVVLTVLSPVLPHDSDASPVAFARRAFERAGSTLDGSSSSQGACATGRGTGSP